MAALRLVGGPTGTLDDDARGLDLTLVRFSKGPDVDRKMMILVKQRVLVSSLSTRDGIEGPSLSTAKTQLDMTRQTCCFVFD